MLKKKERLDYIDICKAIGIILVILGHTHGIPDKLYLLIYSFHMPLFFILSGFVFNSYKNHEMGFKKFFLLKIKQLIIPYFVFSFINLFIEIIWRLFISIEVVDKSYLFIKLRGIFLCYSNVKNMPNCSPLWFLVCLFFACIIMYFLTKLKNKYSSLLVLLCAIIYYFLIPYSLDITFFPFKFPTFLIAVFFMYIGYQLKQLIDKYPKKLNVINIISILVFIICMIVVLITKNIVKVNDNQYGNYLLFLITSVFSSISFIYLLRSINMKSIFLTWLGKNTIYVVAYNYFCRKVVNEVYKSISLFNGYKLHWTVSFVLTFALCLLVILICVFIKKNIKKIKLKH